MSPARRYLLTAVVVACAAIAIWLVWPLAMHKAAQAIIAAREITVTKGAPDFTLKNSVGKRVSLSDFKGKVVVLNFWATWCGPCKTEIPWFEQFQQDWAARGFTVLGVSMDEDGWKAINPFVTEEHMNYPVLLADEEVNQKYGGIDALPTTFLIGRDGKVAFVHSGLAPRGEYEKEIRSLL
jgi:peroxiredoxin